MIHIDLSLPAYLVTYLNTIYGSKYSVSSTDDLGILILNVLKKKVYYYTKTDDSDKRKSTYTVQLSLSMFEKYGCFISSEQITQIYKHIDIAFRRNLYVMALMNKKSFGIDYKYSFIEALNTYSITEEELSYEAIRRDFNRKKMKLSEKLGI